MGSVLLGALCEQLLLVHRHVPLSRGVMDYAREIRRM